MKHWILFSFLFFASHGIFAQQTDEEFLAEVVIGDISHLDSVFYISPESWFPYISLTDWEHEGSEIWSALRDLGVPDSNVFQISCSAIKMYGELQKKKKQRWDKKSKPFEEKEYKQVRFKETKKGPCLHVSKPIFDLNYEYAVVEIKESINKNKFKRYFSLYKKEDSAWKKQGEFGRFMKDDENKEEKRIYLFSNTQKTNEPPAPPTNVPVIE